MLDAGVIDAVKAYNPALAAGVAAAVLLLPLFAGKQLTDWIDVIGYSRRRDIQHLKAALDGTTLPPGATREVLAEHLQARAFQAFVGIYAESEMRDGLIALHADLAPLADWRTIRRARPFFYLCEETGGAKRRRVQPVLSWGDKFMRAYFMVLSLLVAALGSLLLTSAVWSALDPRFAGASLPRFGAALAVFVMAMFLHGQTWPYSDARRIQRALAARGKLIPSPTVLTLRRVRLPPNEVLKLTNTPGASAPPSPSSQGQSVPLGEPAA